MMAHEWLRRADNNFSRGGAEEGLGGLRRVLLGLSLTVEC